MTESKRIFRVSDILLDNADGSPVESLLTKDKSDAIAWETMAKTLAENLPELVRENHNAAIKAEKKKESSKSGATKGTHDISIYEIYRRIIEELRAGDMDITVENIWKPIEFPDDPIHAESFLDLINSSDSPIPFEFITEEDEDGTEQRVKTEAGEYCVKLGGRATRPKGKPIVVSRKSIKKFLDKTKKSAASR